jgi:hypothetical protein
MSASESLMRCRNSRDGVKTGGASRSTGQVQREPVGLMLREELKWKTHKSESTDAGHIGGLTRISDEILVLRMERRG